MAETHCFQASNKCGEEQANTNSSGVPAAAGLVLVDSSARPVYYSSEAITLLSYSQLVNGVPSLPPEIKSWLSRNAASASPWRTLEFTSGRRRYTCRAFSLRDGRPGPSDGLTALLLERKKGNSLHALDIGARFRLSPREEQTVHLLALGLTSKEIATRMNISPNTVKAFFRLVMTKMGVTTRSGVVGRIASL